MTLIRSLLRRTPARPIVLRWRHWRSLRSVTVDVDGNQVTMPRRDVNRYVDWAEPVTHRWLEEAVPRGGVVIDVGAALGVYSLRFEQLVGPSGRVIAVEPAKPNLQLLHRNLLQNGSHVEVIESAAGSEPGTAMFNLTQSSDSHSFYEHPLIGSEQRVAVDVVTVDSLVDQVDFVKIDVEGAELDVLRGMPRLLASRPSLLVEWTPACQRAAGHDPLDLPACLIQHGYEIAVLDDFSGSVRTVEELQMELDELPNTWFANLGCIPAG